MTKLIKYTLTAALAAFASFGIAADPLGPPLPVLAVGIENNEFKLTLDDYRNIVGFKVYGKAALTDQNWTLLSTDVTGNPRAGETAEFTFDSLVPSVAMTSPFQFFKVHAVKGDGTDPAEGDCACENCECDIDCPKCPAIEAGTSGNFYVKIGTDGKLGDIYMKTDEEGTPDFPPTFWIDIDGDNGGPTQVWYGPNGWSTTAPDGGVDAAKHIIPGSKLDDDSDWMAIAEKDGLYLIVRFDLLPVVPIAFGPTNEYSKSYVKQAIEKWWDGDTSVPYGHAQNNAYSKQTLKDFSVFSNADVHTGTACTPSSYWDGISTPNVYIGYAYPFALSSAEKSQFCTFVWRPDYNSTTANNLGRYARSNWNALGTINNDSYYAWLRSNVPFTVHVGGQNHISGVTGRFTHAQSSSIGIRPAIWVKGDIFEL